MVLLDIYDEKAIAARTNENALNELVRENNSFMLRCASKTCKRFITESDDEYEVALVAFCEAVRAFDADAGGFMGFAALVIRRRLMDFFDKRSRCSNEISAGSAMSWDEDVTTGVIAEVQQKLVQGNESVRLLRLRPRGSLAQGVKDEALLRPRRQLDAGSG